MASGWGRGWAERGRLVPVRVPEVSRAAKRENAEVSIKRGVEAHAPVATGCEKPCGSAPDAETGSRGGAHAALANRTTTARGRMRCSRLRRMVDKRQPSGHC